MSKSDEKLALLQTRLENLSRYEAAFKREIADIRRELQLLKAGSESGDEPVPTSPSPPPQPKGPPSRAPQPSKLKEETPETAPRGARPPSVASRPKDSNIERFIGTYLISVVGILVTVIGVGIGAKYAIDNNLISPLTRILLGYAAGILLNAAAVYLKAKYKGFSAVLLSGGMAIVYFITYFAYGYYGLIAQPTAFAMMVIFTVITVLAAIIYDRQVIANIALVGGYAIPFLLSDNTGKAAVLFGYMAVLNIGILAVSVKKYWRLLFYLSFGFTWLIYASWFVERYDRDEHFGIALISISVFYLTFYICFLAYKLIHKKPLGIENIGLVLINSFAYFGFGYAVLDTPDWERYLGLFTIANATVHFAAAYVIHAFKLRDRNAFYLAAALVMVFVSIAVPVQAEGQSITILLMAEAAFLFIVGRVKKAPLFELLSYPVMFLASASLMDDWQDGYELSRRQSAEMFRPVFNSGFVTSLFSAAAFGAICYFNRIRAYKSQVGYAASKIAKYLIPAVFLAILYNAFRIEIDFYFNFKETQTTWRTASTFGGMGSVPVYDIALQHFSDIWQINYSLFFAAMLTYVNISRIKNRVLGLVNLGLIVILIAAFLVVGLYSIGRLREIYLLQEFALQFYRGYFLIGVRYVSLILVAVLIYLGYRQKSSPEVSGSLPAFIHRALDLALCFAGLVLLGNELISWLELYRVADPLRLGLSILWGLYAMALIVFGIARKRKDIRVFAILLFGLTLLKLFFYDMYDMETIPKTVLFISIGFLLLVVSFLYNKFTKRLFGEEAPK